MNTSPHVHRFAELRLTDRPTVGGKGASLGELTFAGAPVPPGYVVTTTAFEAFLATLDPDGEIRTAIEALDSEDTEAITRVVTPVRERIEAAELPEEVAAAIRGRYRDLDSESDTPVSPPPSPYAPAPPAKTRRTPASPASRTPTCGCAARTPSSRTSAAAGPASTASNRSATGVASACRNTTSPWPSSSSA